MAKATRLKRVFVALVILEAVAVASLGIARMVLRAEGVLSNLPSGSPDSAPIAPFGPVAAVPGSVNPEMADLWRLGTLLVVSSAFVGFLGVDGFLNENRFTALTFVGSCILMTGYIFYQFFYAEVDSRDILMVVRFGLTCLASPITIGLSIYLFRYFGWRIYKKIGADMRYISMYGVYQLFVALLRMDAQLQLCLALLLGLFWIEPDFYTQYRFYLDVASIVLTIFLTVIGLVGVRRENKPLTLIYAIFTWVVSGWLAFRGVEYGETHLFDPSSNRFSMSIISLAVGGVSVINRVFLFIWTIRVYRNFGKGLRERIFDHRRLNDDPLASESFLYD